MLRLLKSFSADDWMDGLGLFLVFWGVFKEVYWEMVRFKNPFPDVHGETAVWLKNQWEILAKKKKHRGEAYLIIGLALEIFAFPMHILHAAKVEEHVEGLRKSNNELRAKLQPRRLPGSDRTKFAKLLSNPPWGIVIVSLAMDGEGADFADDLDAAFHEAHWETRRWSTFLDNWNGVFVGMLDGSTDTAQMQKTKEVSAALTAIGIPNEERTIDEAHRQKMSPWFDTNVLYLVVGHKPRAILEEQPEK